jgi:hypothetical protein
MRLATCLTITAFLTSATLIAQPAPPAPPRLAGRYVVTLPQRWRFSNQTPTSMEWFVPLERERKVPAERNDKNPKPPFIFASEAGMLMIVEVRRSHAEALQRLSEIAAERPEPVEKVVIDGWPAIERQFRAVMPQPGEGDRDGNLSTLWWTTAIAADKDVVRFETMLLPDADPKWLADAAAIGRSVRGPHPGDPDVAKREIGRLPTAPAPRAAPSPGEPGSRKPRSGGGPSVGTAVQARTGLGELEVAGSTNGVNILVATNTGFSFSSNSGASWTSGGGTPCNQPLCDGDPSLAVGQSGAFYYAWIGGSTNTTLGDGLSRSTNFGHTFAFQAMAVTCPGASNCQVADQEHIAADRINAGSGGDRLYNVWRNFGSSFSIRIVCSHDNGATWGPQQVIGTGDLPRVAVGSDGFVYAGWTSSSFGPATLMLNKYSNCDAGLVQQPGFPVTVATYTNVVCPVPGLDRCNGRNTLSSQTIAVDDLDPNHVYFAYANSTGTGNEDIIVRDSVNGGGTFPRSVRVNAGVTGRRFLPWVSAYGGVADVSWYDRRFATSGVNDATRFFVGTAKVNGPSLVALGETDLSGNNDLQCSVWPCPTNAPADAESCSSQPQLAGRCSISFAVCDFTTGPCPTGQTCNFGSGCPKYGDYNGNTSLAGRLYSAWASFVPPVGSGGTTGSINVYTSADRVPSDFFVRDWTNNATSHDDGAQPSTNPTFWTTSDVWNQSVSTPELLINDWVLGDPPSRSASNFAFARVSRRAAAMTSAPAAPVTVHFSFADFGAGLNYQAVGNEIVTFAAGDMTKLTPAHSWSIPATASAHICLVAEIDGPDGDVLAPPSVVGLSPGAGIALITIDNNKAQRNLQTTVGTSTGVEMFAIIRNARAVKRHMVMNVTTNAASAGVLQVIGGPAFDLTREGRVDIGELAPGETRWLQLRVTSMPAEGKPLLVDFSDSEPGEAGFAIHVTSASLATVARRNMFAFADVLQRIAVLENTAMAKSEAAEALRVASDRRFGTDSYLKYLIAHEATIGKIVSSHLRKAATDVADIGGAVKALQDAVATKKLDRATTAQNALTERLDAHLSMMVRAK